MVEMAAVLPLLLMMVFGMIESARLASVAQLVQNAAREGCRVAAMPGKTQADVQSRVQAVLNGSGVSIASVVPSPSGWATSARGTAIKLALSVPYSQVGWLGTASMFKDATVRAEAIMCSER